MSMTLLEAKDAEIDWLKDRVATLERQKAEMTEHFNRAKKMWWEAEKRLDELQRKKETPVG